MAASRCGRYIILQNKTILNLDLEPCVFLETENDKADMVYATINRANKHTSRLGYREDQYLGKWERFREAIMVGQLAK